MLVSWARRRHPNKGFAWIMAKYWHRIGNWKHVFSTDSQTLERFSNMKIIRHRLAKLDKNPYIDRDYFERWKVMEYYRKKRISSSKSSLN
jgi:RNA-directed DNA polymerase